MAPAAKNVFAGFEGMLNEAQKAENLFNRLTHYAMVTALPKHELADHLIEELLAVNEGVVVQEEKRARKDSSTAKTTAVIGMILGFIAGARAWPSSEHFHHAPHSKRNRRCTKNGGRRSQANH